MTDSTLLTAPETPALEDIRALVALPLWDDLCGFLHTTWHAAPKLEFSKCSLAFGWNVKYRKGGRALCTLYPAPGAFTCMVSIGQRETSQAELLLPRCTPYVQALYTSSRPSRMGRWLMIGVTSAAILEDVKQLLLLRCPPARKQP